MQYASNIEYQQLQQFKQQRSNKLHSALNTPNAGPIQSQHTTTNTQQIQHLSQQQRQLLQAQQLHHQQRAFRSQFNLNTQNPIDSYGMYNSNI